MISEDEDVSLLYIWTHDPSTSNCNKKKYKNRHKLKVLQLKMYVQCLCFFLQMLPPDGSLQYQSLTFNDPSKSQWVKSSSILFQLL